MYRSDWEAVLDAAGSASLDHLNSLPDRRVYPQGSYSEIRAALDRPPTDAGIDAAQVVHELARDLAPYITAHASGRYFGFVIGGLHPASWGAEILVSSWDQNAGLFPPTPGVSVAEELAAQWLLDLLDFPSGSSVGFVTGGQMATFTCLAAARHELLRALGWDVGADGLTGAPPITVVVKEDAHSTVLRALRLLGLGERAVITVPCDEQSNIRPDALERALESITGPTILTVECGNINTGGFDDFTAVADLAQAHRAAGNPTWVHVDGAVMLLAAASSNMAAHVRGLDRMDRVLDRRAISTSTLSRRFDPVRRNRLVLPECAHRMLAMPARRRAQRVEDPPLLRPFGRPVTLRHRRHHLAPRAHADLSRHRGHRTNSVTPPQSSARSCPVTFWVRQCAGSNLNAD